MQTTNIPLEKLIAYAGNPRKNDHAVEAVASAIKRFGFRVPVLAKSDGSLIDGHLRVKAAKHLGMKEVPVVLCDDLSEADIKALRISINRMAELAEWDSELLSAELEGLAAEGITLEDVGFDAAALEELGASLEQEPNTDLDAEPQIDKAEELRVKWGVEPGQLWELGDHRLLCGDSTKKEDVKKVLQGEPADICFTSPPYALGDSVSLSGNKAMSQKGNAYDSHIDSSEGWYELMENWFTASSEFVAGCWVINVQPLAGNKRNLIRFIANHSDHLVDIATWDKGHAAPQMAAGVMASRYEWMIILSPKSNPSRAVPMSSWQGTVQSVYAAPPQRTNEFSDCHAATMPVHVPCWVLQTLCDQSKTLLEPFCGTGTTIIACEQLGRKCRAIEISPAYVAVALQRWADATGKTPKLAA